MCITLLRLKLNFSLENYVENLFESNNMITSYILELTGYDGLQDYFNQSQKDLVNQTVNLLKSVTIMIEFKKETTSILFYSKEKDILMISSQQMYSINTILTLIYKSSSLSTNSTEGSQMMKSIANYSASLQTLGRMCNYKFVLSCKGKYSLLLFKN